MNLLVTTLLTGALDPSWEGAYVEACRDVEAAEGIAVRDRKWISSEVQEELSLAVRLIPSAEASSDRTRERLELDTAWQEDNPSLSLLVTALGVGHPNAVSVIATILNDGPEESSRWVVGADTPMEFHSHVVYVLTLIIHQRFSAPPVPTSAGTLVAEIVDQELPTNVSTTNPRRSRLFHGRP